MQSQDIRQRFLDFFAARGHEVVESSSLLPQDDPTLLFTNAGMVQFKRVFMGEEKRAIPRAVSCQRCVRAGGKHNDLENVGYTARHHTFFEMLGNFSFGDYFKREAIEFAWTFLTRELGLPPERLWISVFRDDDEAHDLWREIAGVPAERIVRLGEKDNFWAMGDTGPCGPCSEIHLDQGPAAGCGRPDCAVGCDCDRFLELWNLVFMQFYRDADGTLTPLPKPAIDTGMGLERVSAVLQGKFNNFDSDLFQPLIQRVAALSGTGYGSDPRHDTAMRVIADHARATAFLVADGILPSNEGRGYVLRRVMRRAIRYGRSLGLTGRFFGEIALLTSQGMTAAYPHLSAADELLAKVVDNEELRFGETLDHGLILLSAEIERLKTAGDAKPCLGGNFMFTLYDTHGFPVDIVRDVALEQGVGYDEAGFQAAMAQQRQQSKQARRGVGLDHLAQGLVELQRRGLRSEFSGYSTLEVLSRVSALLDAAGQLVEQVTVGAEVAVVCERTPFYAESGGQVGDQGVISGPAGRVRVQDSRHGAEGLTLHHGVVEEGVLSLGDTVTLTVGAGRRNTQAHHSATHLLQAAMKRVLGDHVKQAGSLVNEERLRFDFTHFSPLSRQEIEQIETLVNEQIRADLTVDTALLEREEAIRQGATALFGEKYGETVRVVTVPGFSQELCGGTHVCATGEIGLCKIVSEGGVSAGVRRIEAVCGGPALRFIQEQEQRLVSLAESLGVPLDIAQDRIVALQRRQKELEREVAALTGRLALQNLDAMLDNSATVGGLRVAALRIPLDSAKTLREIGDRVRDRMGSGVAVLGGELEGKASLLALVTKDLTGRIQAGPLAGAVAKIVGGKGGGRPDMAQAGGPLADKIDEALARVPEIVQDLLQGR
ncbi:MAG: alanine--tRNA ligase [Desulfobulbaceae bacterium A2]|nr:MAG: alanine--tRNA ligase [Desulfobulbaceae bacterium A2]